ncbi:hypothetical protein BDBG_17984 [Blastomyces gilchristii SLH14081]|uniref:Uncharacterized protein n=1 Tax=Blastomyces gilchristii (strain SLH14081) TaxID=559298 RepID=A0A179V428_BLAGS|nr:uncharacterized protein BDBG_17984 [Blastomyces gilchristii SLH14081]EQL33523.1 hypothetical protein BDFG_04456 [Blastomyces dermatitidis ATCC 26199]OAT14208.1 hypothetical protein BDBG_17984 [Blastomyces gilchristii SLH14081]
MDADRLQLVCRIATKHCNQSAIETNDFSNGSYNRCFRVKLEHGPDVIVRIHMLGKSFLRREKVHGEVEL